MTNKPEVVAWIWDYRGRHMATTDYSQALELAEPPYPTEVEPLVRLSDYEAAVAADKARIAELEDFAREIIQQYPNPNLTHEQFRVHACKHAEAVLVQHGKETNHDNQ